MSLNELERSEKLQVRIKIRGEVKAAWEKKKKKLFVGERGAKTSEEQYQQSSPRLKPFCSTPPGPSQRSHMQHQFSGRKAPRGTRNPCFPLCAGKAHVWSPTSKADLFYLFISTEKIAWGRKMEIQNNVTDRELK